MSSPVQLPLAARPHRNQQLFSDHYLDALLPQRAEWKALQVEAEAVRQAIVGITGKYVPSTNEAQTEKGLIQPVLEALGHTFEVQGKLKTPGSTQHPDYVFYRDLAALNAHKDKPLTDTLPHEGGFAVGDAKYWDCPLDQTLKSGSGDLLTNKNPSYQIYFYILHSGVEWGILTNGRLWRLYHRESAHKLDRYYEVDLPDVLADPSRFLYFYAFFRRAAFDPGPLSLAEILLRSSEYARTVSDKLKDQVYDALRHLAQGFLDYPANGLQAGDAETLREIYSNSLIVLYRLLFILYAEARELLPVKANDKYRKSYSLLAIKQQFAHDLDRGDYLLPDTAKKWPDLKILFGMIDKGSPPLGVATFNGGLFDPVRHPFLEQYVVGDAHLQRAVDMLARVDKQFVDYRDLAVRHLGAIYEGLLEYHLEPLPSADKDGWTVILLNDKGERKATGSYYTPDYIVKYIVEATLGPVLAAAVAGAADDAAKVEAVLALNVLDPAMGSGHFPVEATEYIARFLVEQGLPPGDAGTESDLAAWKRRVVQSCIYGVDLNPLAVELAKLSLWLSTVARDRPLSFLDHHLRTGNALVGARLAEVQAVAPAGPSARAGARGGKKKEAQALAAGQLSMLDDPAFVQSMSTAVGSMWLIEANPAQTVADVKQQEALYAALHDALTRKYGRLADLIVATHLGLKVDADLWQPLADYAAGRSLAAPAKFDAWLGEAEKLAQDRRLCFFHWDLAFPEVFFDKHGQPRGDGAGFDAIVGNPPYVRQETLGSYKPYFAAAFPETYHGIADLYVYFFHQGLRLLRQGGRMSYIVTNKWMRAGYGEPLRAYFAEQGVLEQIIDFGHAPIFEDADVFPCILVLAKPLAPEDAGPPAERQVTVTTFPREELQKVELRSYVADHHLMVPRSRFSSIGWSLESSEIDDLMGKIRRIGVPLMECIHARPYRGILTGLNEAFVIDTETRDALIQQDSSSIEIIKPCLRGQDIKRWTPDQQGLWLIFTRRGINIDAYPAIKQYLLKFRQQLEPKPKNWNEDKWPGRKPGAYQWYEIQDTIDYWPLFEQPKIVHTDITWRPQFALSEGPAYLLNTAYIWPTTDLYLLAVVNSPLLWAYMWRNAVHGKDEALRLIYSFTETLPIAPPTETIRAEVEPAVARLIVITQQQQGARATLLDWLRTEFGVATPGQRLEDFTALSSDAFVEEVRKRRPKAAGPLSPAGLKALRAGYAEQAPPVQQSQAEAAGLERRLADLVNAAYALTPEEIALLWATAPPRMPRF